MHEEEEEEGCGRGCGWLSCSSGCLSPWKLLGFGIPARWPRQPWHVGIWPPRRQQQWEATHEDLREEEEDKERSFIKKKKEKEERGWLKDRKCEPHWCSLPPSLRDTLAQPHKKLTPLSQHERTGKHKHSMATAAEPNACPQIL